MNQWTTPPDGSPPEPRGPFTPITLGDLGYIVYHLREASHLEVFGLVDHDDPDQVAHELYDSIVHSGFGRIAWHDGKPAVWMAIINTGPGTWHTPMAGTDDLPKVAIECVRWFRWAAKIGIRFGGHTLTCMSRITPDGAPQKFIKASGAAEHGPPVVYGRDGSLYQPFHWPSDPLYYPRPTQQTGA